MKKFYSENQDGVNVENARLLRELVDHSRSVGSVPISGSREEMKMQMQRLREENARTKKYYHP